MSKPLAGTKTEKNLWTAFAGESQARNKYDYFAGVARKEGFQQIAAIFEETASNEKAHAKIWFKELQGIGNTAENLKAAASGEHYEWTDMYDQFAKDAEEAISTGKALQRQTLPHCTSACKRWKAKSGRKTEKISRWFPSWTGGKEMVLELFFSKHWCSISRSSNVSFELPRKRGE